MEIIKITLDQLHLVVALFNQYRIFYRQTSNLNLAHQFLKERLQNNESHIFVALAEKDNQKIPVGFTQLYPLYSSVNATKNWILNDLFVHPDYRNKSAGLLLVQAALQFAKATHATFVQLETAVDNTTAKKLYERIGFEAQKPDTTYIVYRKQV